MKNHLKEKKLSETPFRKEVLDIFLKYNNAIPISLIEKELKKYNRITLYRTIKIFIEKGLIHEITISGAASNYALCKEDCEGDDHKHQHIHFKCKICSIVYCVEINPFPILSLPNFTIDQMDIQAVGICENCNK